jgi:hypothetical protein
MTAQATEWTVLITVAQAQSQAAISDDQSRRILDLLGPDDAWIQYPPASGRGHGFETRWWQDGTDAASVAVEAIERFREAATSVGLDVDIVLVHVATPEDRLNETVIGLERPAPAPDVGETWNVSIRALGPASGGDVDRDALVGLLARLPGGGSSGFSRSGLVEVRFWMAGDDAVDAADRASQAFADTTAELGRTGWTIVRIHVTSLVEARRTAYLGVERRVRARDRSSRPVVIHP